MIVPVYLQIEPRGWNGDDGVTRAVLARATSRPPTDQKSGTALVYLELDLPASAFEPIASARVEIPESAVQVKVDVTAPGLDEDQAGS